MQTNVRARVHQLALTRIIVRAECAGIVHVVPGIVDPIVDAPVEQPVQAEALVDETGLNAEVDGVEINLPFGGVGILHQGVVGPCGVTLLLHILDLGLGAVVHERQHYPDVNRRTPGSRSVAVKGRRRRHRHEVVDTGLVHVASPLLKRGVEIRTTIDLVGAVIVERQAGRLRGGFGLELAYRGRRGHDTVACVRSAVGTDVRGPQPVVTHQDWLVTGAARRGKQFMPQQLFLRQRASSGPEEKGRLEGRSHWQGKGPDREGNLSAQIALPSGHRVSAGVLTCGCSARNKEIDPERLVAIRSDIERHRGERGAREGRPRHRICKGNQPVRVPAGSERLVRSAPVGARRAYICELFPVQSIVCARDHGSGRTLQIRYTHVDVAQSACPRGNNDLKRFVPAAGRRNRGLRSRARRISYSHAVKAGCDPDYWPALCYCDA